MENPTDLIAHCPKGLVSYHAETDVSIESGVCIPGEPTGNYILRDVYHDKFGRRCTTFIGTVYQEEYAVAICKALNGVKQ